MSDPTTPPSLLERLRQPDDRGAWDRFVELYAPLIRLWAGTCRVPEGDRDDVVQDVFAALAGALPTFQYDPSRRFRGYLFTVTRSRANDWHRRTGSAVTLDHERAGSDDAIGDMIDAEYHRYLLERAVAVMRAEFEEKTWTAFWETTYNGRSSAEVAQQLGMTVAAVYTATSRVSRRLRRELEGLWE
jgi:RNA polymerase sigma-70 factor (ECF subfamily)